MKYMGSKNRHAKELLPIILKDRKPEQCYVEPFVGGCNMIDKVGGYRIGNDRHKYLIALFKAIINGWEPPEYVDEETYKDVRENKDKHDDHFVGFVGFGCSYSGKWFGGFARNVRKDAPDAEILNKTKRNYCAESKRNIMRQASKLQDVILYNVDYWMMYIPLNSIIYCDPPYAGTTKYKDGFDHDTFWKWCREMVRVGHTVFVSEYNAPEDFECVWEKTVNNTLTKDTGSKQGVEKLFVYKAEGLDLARG